MFKIAITSGSQLCSIHMWYLSKVSNFQIVISNPENISVITS